MSTTYHQYRTLLLLPTLLGLGTFCYLSPWLPLERLLPKPKHLLLYNQQPTTLNNTTKNHNNNAENNKLLIVIPSYRENYQQAIDNIINHALFPDRLHIVIVACGDHNSQSSAATTTTTTTTLTTNQSNAIIQIIIPSSSSPSGRGPALNMGFLAGIQTTRQEIPSIVLFLHADAIPPQNFDSVVLKELETQKNTLMTCFSLSVPDISPFVAIMANIRSKILSFPYGDQGLALRCTDFIRLGMFPNFLMMEDFEFVRHVRAIAYEEDKSIVVLPFYIEASNRRWKQNGVLKNTILNWLFCFAYMYLGMSPEYIYELYYGRRPG
jgi:hypothetical protein